MAYIGEITFNIHGITIHSSQIPFNCKDLPSLSSNAYILWQRNMTNYS
jgi:hypothetical protein